VSSVRISPVLERSVDRIPGGSWFVERQHPPAQQAVDQGRLADIGAPDDGEPQAVTLFLRAVLFLRGGQYPIDGFHQVVQATAVRGGHGKGLTHAKAGKLGQGGVLVHAVDLVRHQDHGPGRAPQQGCDFLVFRGQAIARAQHEEHELGLVDRMVNLTRRQVLDPFRLRNQSAGIHQQARDTTDA
jgi:hypothetical protein